MEMAIAFMLFIFLKKKAAFQLIFPPRNILSRLVVRIKLGNVCIALISLKARQDT